MHFSSCSSVTVRKFASKFADRTEVLIRQCKRKSGLRPWWGKGKRNIADAGYGAGDCSVSNPDIAPSSCAMDCTEEQMAFGREDYAVARPNGSADIIRLTGFLRDDDLIGHMARREEAIRKWRPPGT
jgi:hypothetical protein